MESPLRIILFGPPGAGKGTQAELLKDQLDIPHVSSGDLFRYHMNNGTALGLKAAEFMTQGLLVPDEITISIILDKLSGIPQNDGFLLDGFPRTMEQALILKSELNRISRNIDAVLYINVPEKDLIARLSNRFVCSMCQSPYTITRTSISVCEKCGADLYQREDDQPEAINKRIQVYRSETLPLIDFYHQENILHDISGIDTVQQVNINILKSLDILPESVTPCSQVKETGVE
ncbi:MAG: adenylate kinase [Chloroflexota bacterium]|nr:adenylate kinase [Chloroflexota bacterium]